jgi:hypothetical protein
VNYSPDKYVRQGQRRVFEALAVILLSLATIGSAWCSYQASAWGTQASKLSMQSLSRGRDASAYRIKANQLFMLDVHVFGEYAKAHDAGNELLAQFYVRKFRPELKHAFESWLKTKPLENPAAPADPFDEDLYQPRLLAEAVSKEVESERLWDESNKAARTGHAYILVSVLLATALFFAGTAPQFETYKARRVVLGLGLVVLLTAATTFLRLPLTTSSGIAEPKFPADLAR